MISGSRSWCCAARAGGSPAGTYCGGWARTTVGKRAGGRGRRRTPRGGFWARGGRAGGVGDPLYAVEEFLGLGNAGGGVGGEPSGAADRLSGAYEARELVAEMQAPLLHGRPLARDLTLIFGARWSDYSSFDANLSWQAGLR